MPKMSPTEAVKWDDIIRKVVVFVSHDFPDIDRDDLSQDLWVWLMKQHNLINHGPDRSGVVTIVRRRARFQAWQIRKEHLQQTAQYSYRNSDVRKILETVFDYMTWQNGFVPKDARSPLRTASGMVVDPTDAIDVRADVTWAFETLSEAHRKALLFRYRDGEEPAGGSSERRQLNRAIERLTDRMNSYQFQRRPRKVISNATARYIIENQESQ